MLKDSQSGAISRRRLSSRTVLILALLVAWWTACANAPTRHFLAICEMVEWATNDRATDDTVRYVMDVLDGVVCLVGSIAIVAASLAINRKRIAATTVVDGGASL